MEKAWIVACTLLFTSVAGFAQMPTQPPLTSTDLGAILDQPGVDGSCTAQESRAIFATCTTEECCSCEQTHDCFDCCLCNGSSMAVCNRRCISLRLKSTPVDQENDQGGALKAPAMPLFYYQW
jgi:hypothetical protein